MTKKALVVCPGRGTYNAAELGYLHKHHGHRTDLLTTVDRVRQKNGQMPITELDGTDAFKMSLHGTGDNASLLIYSCALGDYAAINRDAIEVVAVTGNSMGWYLALACAGALSLEDGTTLVNEMGSVMHETGVGGQIIYPIVDADWNIDPTRLTLVEKMLTARTDERFIDISIRLGGMVVFAADEAGLAYLMENLPKDDRFPMRLPHHAAFHSALLDHCVTEAQKRLSCKIFQSAHLPMIDGRGVVWRPGAYEIEDLYQYTLGHQINRTFNFSKAIEVSVKEYAPDVIIVLGPGTTLGAPVAQQLINMNWRGLTSKTAFKEQAGANPYVISMGMENQRKLVI